MQVIPDARLCGILLLPLSLDNHHMDGLFYLHVVPVKTKKVDLKASHMIFHFCFVQSLWSTDSCRKEENFSFADISVKSLLISMRQGFGHCMCNYLLFRGPSQTERAGFG